MVFPGPECRRSKRISFWVLSARMTNPSSSTSRGEFCGNEWEHTCTEEGDTSWIRDKRLISDTKKCFVTRCNWALRPVCTESFPLVGINTAEKYDTVWCESVTNCYSCCALNTFLPAARWSSSLKLQEHFQVWRKSFKRGWMSGSESTIKTRGNPN